MLGIINLSTFIIGTVMIIILPGPNSFYTLSIASKYGVKAGYKAALGVISGDFILILATIFGAASLLHSFPILFLALKSVGAIYLSYLGIKLIKHSIFTWKNRNRPVAREAITLNVTHKKETPYKTALTISLLNPKAILFFLSFFIQFVDPKNDSPLLSFLVLSLILEAISITYLTLLIFSGIKLSGYFAKNLRLTSISILIVGFLFIGFGIKLALSNI
ncbi:leucine efflux protein LeuE [Acinetobacter sp. B10A]|uniref:leucine efflux protein LeuE n=1 Tax=Acinetobacter baretiae TaxID=2605383 RepID=UPI001B3C4CC9|nr:leucine efflux protein LeuE [Acinetobacter baretiae]MBF7685228.1 leucine efflux protein LeuE [Acinetobacter baretiae]